MLFFLSPSKTMKIERKHKLMQKPVFAKVAQQLRQELQALSSEQLQQQFKLSAKQVSQVQAAYQVSEPVAAIDLYQGSVFQQLQPDAYTKKQHQYLAEQVVILSAVYGYVRPFDGILPYRLDLKQALIYEGQSLTKYWQAQITPLVTDQICINLASSEFARLLPKTAITIDFVESFEQDKPKRLATYAKIARGQFLHSCITEAVMTVEQLQRIQTQRYQYVAERSTPTHYVFLKKVE